MKSIVIVNIVSVIVSIGIYKGIRKVLYKKDVQIRQVLPD